jgi:hypothetical protein
MSYSRWSNSRWYTFWTSFSGDTKNSQAFEVMIDCARTRVCTYAELTKDTNECLSEIAELCSNPIEYSSPKEILTEEFKPEPTTIFDRMIYVTEISEPDPATVEELRELRIYMENFISDVDWDYSILGKLTDFCTGKNITSNFGWWLDRNFKPKRKKYKKSKKEKYEK